MLKASLIAVALAASLGTAAVAQTVEIGPNGPSLDLRSQRQRERDFQREEIRRDRDRERDYDRRASRRDGRDDLATGSTRCRTTTVRERDDYGRMVTRETRDCR